MTIEGDKIREQVETLRAAVASASVVINVNTAGLEEKFADAANTITVQANTILSQGASIEALIKQNGVLADELAECQGGHPVDPTLFIGACPATQGTINTVVSKYKPEPIGVRWFTNEGLSVVAPRPVGISKLHASASPALGSTITDTLVLNFTKNAVEGDIFTLHHETPTKVRDGRFTAAQANQALKQMNDMHTIIDRLRTRGDIPFIYDCFVEAAWMWDTTNNQNPLYPGNDTDPRTAMWWGKRVVCDLVGNDLDAYASTRRYPDFKSTIDNCIKFAKEYNFKGITIPEFIHFRIDGDDTGQGRADWMDATLEYLTQGEMFPHAVMLFDRDWKLRVQEVLPGTPEFAVIKHWQQAAQ